MRHLTDDQRARLLDLAESVISRGVRSGGENASVPSLGEWADAPTATFVTVHVGGQLNGCIGTLSPVRSLSRDIAHHARSAAFQDPRFRPISEDDLANLEVHISILGPLEELDASSDAELLAVLDPGVHGAVLDDGVRRATFLPSVWNQLPRPPDFLSQLKRKAGIDPSTWPAGLRAHRFVVDEFDRESLAH